VVFFQHKKRGSKAPKVRCFLAFFWEVEWCGGIADYNKSSFPSPLGENAFFNFNTL